jgi:hypothetical protein
MFLARNEGEVADLPGMPSKLLKKQKQKKLAA